MKRKNKQYLSHGDVGITESTQIRYKLSRANESDENAGLIDNPNIDASIQVDSHDRESPSERFSHNSNSSADENNQNDEFDSVQDDETPEKDNDSFWKFKSLQDFIQSEQFSQIVDAKIDKTNGEIFFMLLKYSTCYNLSMKAMVDLFKLVNNLCETPIVPDSKHSIDKLINPKTNVEFHAVCNKCSSYLGQYGTEQLSEKCNNCDTTVSVAHSSNDSFFCLIDPSTQITDLLEMNDDHYNYVVNERVAHDNCIEDIYDGKLYREFQDSLPPEKRYNYVTATFNTDGALKFENSQRSIWPLYLMLNELPIRDRLKNILCCGLWFNDNKPYMPTYLQKFVNLINVIKEKGIKCIIKGQARTLSLFILSAIVDAVARAPVQGILQFNGHSLRL